jgi:hypothetical protein
VRAEPASSQPRNTCLGVVGAGRSNVLCFPDGWPGCYYVGSFFVSGGMCLCMQLSYMPWLGLTSAGMLLL